MSSRRQWRDLSPSQRAAVLALASVQLSMAATAWADLASRPAAAVDGRKPVWAAVIAINFVGPLAYFAWGRRNAGTAGWLPGRSGPAAQHEHGAVGLHPDAGVLPAVDATASARPGSPAPSRRAARALDDLGSFSRGVIPALWPRAGVPTADGGSAVRRRPPERAGAAIRAQPDGPP